MSVREFSHQHAIYHDSERPEISLQSVSLAGDHLGSEVQEGGFVGIVDVGVVWGKFLQVHEVDQSEVTLAVHHKALDLQLSPDYSPAMDVFHNVDYASGKVFNNIGAEFLLPVDKVIKIFSFDPSSHEVKSVFVCEDAILFGDEWVCEFSPHVFETYDSVLHFFLQSFGFVDHSHGELDIAVRFDFECGSVVSNALGINDSEVFQGQICDILLNLIDGLDLFPDGLVQIDEGVEAAVVSFLDGLDIDEGHSPTLSLD